MPIAYTYIEPIRVRGSGAARPGLALRLRVRWNALALDSALAGGADPGASDELTLRAQQLAQPKTAEEMARSIGHLLELVDRSSAAQLAVTRMPFGIDQVQAVRPRLVKLAERLRAKGSHPVRGLAMANLLLEDGGGPLYVHDTLDGLERAVGATLSAIDC